MRKRTSTRTSTSTGRSTLKPTMSGLSGIRQRGQEMVEYAFILVLIALVVIAMLVTTGGQVLAMYSDITSTFNNQAGL